jgi:hypothetical protein
MGHHPQDVKGVGVTRLALKDSKAESLGPLELSATELLNGFG